MSATVTWLRVTPGAVAPPLSPCHAPAHGAAYTDSTCRGGLPYPLGQARGAAAGGPAPGPPPTPTPGPTPSPSAAGPTAVPAPAVALEPWLNWATSDCE